jgi:2-polyprenyl-3-methyl-5-hydroxy-6-metoxy-1,4-benzoquinol methylase
MARQRKDTTISTGPAHYGLANQIKCVRLYDQVLQFVLQKHPTESVHLVDVGCAGGLLLMAAQVLEDSYNIAKAPRFEVRGISMDPREREETHRNVGCPVATPHNAAREWTGWADVATLMNVLEHVNNPTELIGHIRAVLRPGGIVIIDVPNNQIVSIRGTISRKWPFLALDEHVNHFVPATLDGLMMKEGFSPVRRFPGLLYGADSLGRRPDVRRALRWFGSWIIMKATAGRVQVFPHMTIAYTRANATNESAIR